MKSVFVFARLIDGVEHFAIGIGQLPSGCKQVGCFQTIEEARAHRDRLRRGKVSVTRTTATQPRTCKRSEMASHAIA